MRSTFYVTAVAALLGLGGCVGAPGPAPVYGAAPGYTGAPVYVPPGYSVGAPAQIVAAPPTAVAYGVTCSAGVYTCTLPEQLPIGTQCSCPGLGAPSFGAVR